MDSIKSSSWFGPNKQNCHDWFIWIDQPIRNSFLDVISKRVAEKSHNMLCTIVWLRYTNEYFVPEHLMIFRELIDFQAFSKTSTSRPFTAFNLFVVTEIVRQKVSLLSLMLSYCLCFVNLSFTIQTSVHLLRLAVLPRLWFWIRASDLQLHCLHHSPKSQCVQ